MLTKTLGSKDERGAKNTVKSGVLKKYELI